MDIFFIKESLFFLLRGAFISLQIAFIACMIGLTLGTILALIQTGKQRFLKFIVTTYVTIIRGTPMLVQ
ncbi:ABC transporter permease subunit, partial [Candidatus Dependentiae bacterium]|nr:ABC transporter permease subunit [Candidatus Dependentiae bacterium]